MRNAILGSGLIVGLIMMAVGGLLQRTPTFGQEPSIIPVVQRTGELLALSSDAGQGRQQVTVIDSKTRVMSVYHIDHSTGAITLKSVRNIEADLLIDELNTESPLPREIRAMLTNR